MVELTRRYVVMAMATEAPFDVTDVESVFVLKPWKDPAAVRALEAYRDHCYPELARDLEAWLRAIREGGSNVRGSVGRRNEPYAARGARAASTTRGGAARRHHRAARAPSRAKRKRRR